MDQKRAKRKQKEQKRTKRTKSSQKDPKGAKRNQSVTLPVWPTKSQKEPTGTEESQKLPLARWREVFGGQAEDVWLTKGRKCQRLQLEEEGTAVRTIDTSLSSSSPEDQRLQFLTKNFFSPQNAAGTLCKQIDLKISDRKTFRSDLEQGGPNF